MPGMGEIDERFVEEAVPGVYRDVKTKTVSVGAYLSANDYVKVFIWDSLEGLTPLTKALNVGTLNGLSHDQCGVRWPPGALPLPTFTSAVTESTVSMTNSMASRIFWKFADTSMPT